MFDDKREHDQANSGGKAKEPQAHAIQPASKAGRRSRVGRGRSSPKKKDAPRFGAIESQNPPPPGTEYMEPDNQDDQS